MDEERALLLVSGYVRATEVALRLFMSIPNAITQMVYGFYPRLRRIGDDSFNTREFVLSEDRTLINGDGCCSSYLIYAECDEGYTTGIHLWSVKALVEPNCYRYIGIINQKQQCYISQCNALINDTIHCLYPRKSELWKADTTMTVKLDCNQWTASFYENDVLSKEETIEEGHAYYFVLKLCASKKFTSLQCVESTIRVKMD
eukprot:511735_1